MAFDISRAIELCEDFLREHLSELNTHLVWKVVSMRPGEKVE